MNKRTTLTICLLATLSFNLSHLFDQPVAGQGEFASTDHDAHVQDWRRQQEEEARARQGTAGGQAGASVAGAPAGGATPPGTSNGTRPAQQGSGTTAGSTAGGSTTGGTTTGGTTGGTTAGTASAAGGNGTPARIAVGAVKTGKIKYKGQDVDVEFIKVSENQVAVKSKSNDPNLKFSDQGACRDSRCDTFIMEASIDDSLVGLQNLASRVAEAYASTNRPATAGTTAPKADEDHCAVATADKMTQTQKDKCADQLLGKVEKECSVKEKVGEQVDCYANELKSLLGEVDNRKIISQSKVSSFIDNHVKDQLKEHLIESNLSSAASKQVDKLHKALPGQYKDARTSITEAARDAFENRAGVAKDANRDVQNLRKDVAALMKDLGDRNSHCGKSIEAFEMCKYELATKQEELAYAARYAVKVGGKLPESLRRLIIDNTNGVNWARRTHKLDDLVSTNLIRRIDSLRLELPRLVDPRFRDENDSREYTVPVRGSRTSSLPNGVQTFRTNTRLSVPAGVRSNTTTTGTRTAPVLRRL